MKGKKTLSAEALSCLREGGINSGRQLTDRLRRAIIEGVIPLGHKMPSVRDLSTQFDVSRSTIVRCFEELASQGYIITSIGSGTTVCERLPGDIGFADLAPYVVSEQGAQARTSARVSLSNYGQRLLNFEEAGSPLTVKRLNPGGPPLDAAPIQRWRELLERHCRFRDLNLLEYSVEPFGFPPLREAYAAYLMRNRAVRCSAKQVIVFIARELRLDLIARILLEEGDAVAVENPGYPGARQRLAMHGARVIPIPVDHQGLDVDYLEALTESVRIVYVTPSHHEPTGVVMPMSRRKKLIEWAQRNSAFIIEDDYDSEFRYDGRPIPSLQGLDETDSVIHLSCLWKILSPVSKIGFLVVPNCLIDVFECTKTLIERDTPLIDQFVLADFINEGHLERQIGRNRKLYAQRRNALVAAIKRTFGAVATVATESAGMDLFVHFDLPKDDDVLLDLAEKSGLLMSNAAPYYVGADGCRGRFIIPFSRLATNDIAALVERFHSLVRN